MTQVEQRLTSLEHLLHGVRTKQVIIDEVQLVGIFAAVALGPLLRITNRTDTAQVDARHQIRGVVLLDEVRERQVGRIRMVDMAPHDERESTHAGRPQDIRVGRSLGATLQRTLVNGAELVHVIALVRARTGIHKREHTGNEQRRLVVRHSERSGKDSTRLTILSLAVAEEQRIAGRIVMPQLTGLPHETAGQHHSIVDVRATGDDEVVADNPISNVYRSSLVTVDTTVIETASTNDSGMAANAYVLDRTCIHNRHMVAYRPHCRSVLIGIEFCYLFQPGNEFGTVAVKCHDISQMRRQLIVDKYLAATGFVEDRDLDTVSETRKAVDEDDIHILNERVVPNLVVGNVVLHVLNATVVTHSDVVQCHVTQSRMLANAARQCKFGLEHTQSHLTRKTGMMYKFGRKAFRHTYFLPIVGQTRLALEPKHFVFGQFSIRIHSIFMVYAGVPN